MNSLTVCLIDLYLTVTSPPCRTVLMVAKELKIDINEKVVNMRNGDNRTPEFLKLNPAHSVPTIVDDGFSLWESRAIAQYLCNKYAPDSDLYPKDPKKRADVDRMLNFDMGSFWPALRGALMGKIYRGTEPTEEQLTSLKNTLKLLDTLIGSNGYVAAKHLTIADLSLLSGSAIFSAVNYDLSDYPNVKQWYEKLQNELPYVKPMYERAKQAMEERMRALNAEK